MENRVVGRDIEESIRPFLKRDEIIIIRGPRQAGKTTLMHIIGRGIEYEKVFVDMDIPSNRAAISESPLEYIRGIMKGERLALFLDEIQRLDNAGEILKVIYDSYKGRVKIVATGSSSLEIKSKVLGDLVGRAIVFDLFTFGFGEFLRVRDEKLHDIFYSKRRSLLRFIEKGKEAEAPAWSERLLENWKEYVVFGGYPEVIKTTVAGTKERLLANIADLYIEKDIVSFFKIENTREFRNFVKALSMNAAQVLQLSVLGSEAGLTYYKAGEFMNILENTYVAERVYPYFSNSRTSIRKSPKLFFFDMGLRNAVLGNLSKYGNRDDAGRLAENFVFGELRRLGYNVRYWRTKSGAEMDFVLEIGNGLLPIEVKLGGSGSLGKSFYSFIERYNPDRAVVVTLKEFSMRQVGSTKVLSVPIFYF